VASRPQTKGMVLNPTVVGRRGSALGLALLLVVACGGADVPSQAPTDQLSPTPAASPTATTSLTPAPSPTIGQTTPDAPLPTPTPTPTPVSVPGDGLADGLLHWTQLDVAGGPLAREDQTFTLDGDGKYGYLFGGRAGSQAFSDLWRYDLAADLWQLIEPPGPVPDARFGHVAVWQPEFGLVVWSGQQSATVFFADIWAFDPATEQWQELPDAGDVPPARYGSCGAIGPDGRLWISHGFTEDAGRFSDTRAYDFDRLAWSDETPAGNVPVLRCLHDCLWTPDSRFVLYAGQTTGAPAIGDLWAYDFGGQAWAEAERPVAPSRQLYAFGGIGNTAFVFGGAGTDGQLLDDLWRLDLGGLTMTPAEVAPGDGPTGRSGATMVSDEARGRLLLFGGKGQAGELNDLWTLSAAP
jgi:hypothetical protein